jgi:GNAT superfamily N-acetyltransferase
MTVEIVKPNENHVSEIANLWMEFMLYTRYVDPIFAPRDEMIPIFIKEYLRPAMEAKNSLILVAVVKRQVVGYSYSLINKPSNLQDRPIHGCIHDMFITVKHRRQGIGENMLVEIMKWFKSRDIQRIELDVLAQNKVAASFWEKQGFTDFQRTVYRYL